MSIFTGLAAFIVRRMSIAKTGCRLGTFERNLTCYPPAVDFEKKCSLGYKQPLCSLATWSRGGSLPMEGRGL